MAQSKTKYIGKSKKYRNVYKYIGSNGNKVFEGRCLRYKKQGFLNERECALWVDKQLLSKGKEPINILKRISNKK